jgi:hypothetical protein
MRAHASVALSALPSSTIACAKVAASSVLGNFFIAACRYCIHFSSSLALAVAAITPVVFQYTDKKNYMNLFEMMSI